MAKLEQQTPTPASLDLSRMTDEELTAALLEDLRQILADPQSPPEELRQGLSGVAYGGMTVQIASTSNVAIATRAVGAALPARRPNPRRP